MSIRIKVKGSEYGYFDVSEVQGDPSNKEGKISFVNTAKNGNKTKVILDASEISAYEETLDDTDDSDPTA